jgi:hypothetical protein
MAVQIEQLQGNHASGDRIVEFLWQGDVDYWTDVEAVIE